MSPYDERNDGMAKNKPTRGDTKAMSETIMTARKYLRVFSADTYTASIFCCNKSSRCRISESSIPLEVGSLRFRLVIRAYKNIDRCKVCREHMSFRTSATSNGIHIAIVSAFPCGSPRLKAFVFVPHEPHDKRIKDGQKDKQN